jgi:hypothetical protein
MASGMHERSSVSNPEVVMHIILIVGLVVGIGHRDRTA